MIEVELAFMYEVLFTSNGFLHYYEARTSSLWAFTSFIGIYFVGVATAIPGTLASRHHDHHHHHVSTSTGGGGGPGTGTVIVTVDTTTADLAITLVIPVSLALLQLVQLIRCWTSNWARVVFACEYAATRPRSRKVKKTIIQHSPTQERRTEVSEQEPVMISSGWWPWPMDETKSVCTFQGELL